MTDKEKLTKYEVALTKIYNLKSKSGMPFFELFAQATVNEAFNIAATALDKPTDYSKQPKLEFKS